MRLHRFFISEPIGNVGSFVAKNQGLLKQWRNVFRYTTGSRVLLFDGTGAEYLALIESITPDRAQLQILEKVEKKGEESGDDVDDTEGGAAEKNKMKTKNSKHSENIKKQSIFLFLSIIKNNNFDLVLQKATEIGVDTIVPLISSRTIKKDINMERAKKIVIEAAEQSGRVSVPSVEAPINLKTALNAFAENVGSIGSVIICQAGGQEWNKVWTKKIASEKNIAFVVGPEGGWSPEELEYFKDKKFTTLAMGENILRAETAAIAALSLAILQ